ncbi:MAG: hypothetical protein GTO40_04275, partial [Deltaproteobacteria bacterium]|nr:hypothetical protein [Deltaproteobacteria bacterium]
MKVHIIHRLLKRRAWLALMVVVVGVFLYRGAAGMTSIEKGTQGTRDWGKIPHGAAPSHADSEALTQAAFYEKDGKLEITDTTLRFGRG